MDDGDDCWAPRINHRCRVHGRRDLRQRRGATHLCNWTTAPCLRGGSRVTAWLRYASTTGHSRGHPRRNGFFASYDWRLLLGATVIVSNWPYTLLVIVPTNNRLMATAPEAAGPEARRTVEHWAALHAGRAALGVAAALIFLWALY